MELGTEKSLKWALAIIVVFGLIGIMFYWRLIFGLKAFLLLSCIVLIGTILLQAGKGGGLAAIGGLADQSAFGTRTSTFLSKLTYLVGAAFIIATICLTKLSSMHVIEKAPLRQAAEVPAAPPAGHPPVEKAPQAMPREEEKVSPALGWQEKGPAEEKKPTEKEEKK